MFLSRIYPRKYKDDRTKTDLIFVTLKLCNEYNYTRGESNDVNGKIT